MKSSSMSWPSLDVFGLVVSLLFGFIASTSVAQTYTRTDFNCNTEGCNPQYPATLAQGRDGHLYGTMPKGGTSTVGTFFSVNLNGSTPAITVPYTFDGTHGLTPFSGVTLGIDGNFYGTTNGGGLNLRGTIFKIIPGMPATITTLYNFRGSAGTSCPTSGRPDGGNPYGAPILGADLNYYGSTSRGTAYKITAGGQFAALCSASTLVPFGSKAPVIQASNGYFYGTSTAGNGTVFRFSTSGATIILHPFNGKDGSTPNAPVLQASDGNLYGTTATDLVNASGEVFRLSPGGTFSILHAFDRNAEFSQGFSPAAGLIEATDGKLYGSTQYGGDPGCGPFGKGCGVLFVITKSGTFSVLHTFHLGEPSQPQATQMQHTNGKIYGLVNGPNYSDGGAVYSLDVGLKKFAFLMTKSGKSGQTVEILGNALTGTTSVKFGSGAASFTVISDTYLTANVPASGTTGFISVVTPSATLTSSKIYKVIPSITSFNPPSGPVGTQVTITGSGLTQVSRVTFGGVKATVFTINSATQVTAIVPVGATTGKIGVTTPGGSVNSSGIFTVI